MSPEKTSKPDIRPPHGERLIWVQWPFTMTFVGISHDRLMKVIGDKVDGLIRMHHHEYNGLLHHISQGPLFMHFNLQNSGHQPGKTYRIAQIYERFPEDNEPALDPFFGPDMECVTVKNNVALENLTEEDFEHSVPWIKDAEQLKRWILMRYHSLYPQKKPDELFELGVGTTLLKDIPRGPRIKG